MPGTRAVRARSESPSPQPGRRRPDATWPEARGHGTDAAAPAAPVTDDSAVSDDDEDIEQSGDVGRTVIEKVLGGRVVSETTD